MNIYKVAKISILGKLNSYNYLLILILNLLIIIYSSCITPIQHDEDLASIKAVEFAKTAFIEHDYAKAFRLLPSEIQKKSSVEKLSDKIKQMHPATFPSVVTATEFEPLPGQKAMRIFLYGENQEEKFYYMFIMDGTADTGYGVSGLYRSTEPFQPSQLRQPLPEKRSTNN